MSNVECTGREASLLDCFFYGLNQSTITPACSRHATDAGVVCSSEIMPTKAWVEEGMKAKSQEFRTTGSQLYHKL